MVSVKDVVHQFGQILLLHQDRHHLRAVRQLATFQQQGVQHL